MLWMIGVTVVGEQERRAGTLDLLMSTPLSTKSLLGGWLFIGLTPALPLLLGGFLAYVTSPDVWRSRSRYVEQYVGAFHSGPPMEAVPELGRGVVRVLTTAGWTGAALSCFAVMGLLFALKLRTPRFAWPVNLGLGLFGPVAPVMLAALLCRKQAEWLGPLWWPFADDPWMRNNGLPATMIGSGIAWALLLALLVAVAVALVRPAVSVPQRTGST